MFVGYSVDHANDLCQMLNLETKGVDTSRHIKWLNLYHNDCIAKKSPVQDQNIDDDHMMIPKKPSDVQEASDSSSNHGSKAQVEVY
jgi:hypothetical protein